MSITDMITKTSPWYFLIMILFSLFYAIRGLMSEMNKYGKDEKTKTQSTAFKVIYSYIQEVLFKIIFTASGFIALLVVNYIFSSVKSIDQIGIGTAIILIFLIIWGIIYFHLYLIRRDFKS